MFIAAPSQSSFCWLFLETKTWSGIMDLGGGELQACAVQALGFPRWAAGGDASAGACNAGTWIQSWVQKDST